MKRTLSLLAGLVLVVSAQAQLISQWTFETSLPNGPYNAGQIITLAPEVGLGTARGFHSGPSVYSNPVGNGSAESWSSTNWAVGDYYEFELSTLGYTGIQVSYDQISSSTGPGRFSLSYSLNGTDFISIVPEYTVLVNSGDNSWSSTLYKPASHFDYDLSTIAGLNNAAVVYFRITDISTQPAGTGTTVATTGTSRLDNFTVGVVPEPSCALLIGAGLLALALRRRNG